MYKAIELYPRPKTKEEYPVKTAGYYARMSAVKIRLTRQKTFGYNAVPNLEEYLSLADFYHWDLSRDVNYAYAMVLYPPEEIKRRILRLYGYEKGITACLMNIGFHIDKSYDRVKETVNYRPRRSVITYSQVMKFLAGQEQLSGYSDALDFED